MKIKVVTKPEMATADNMKDSTDADPDHSDTDSDASARDPVEQFDDVNETEHSNTAEADRRIKIIIRDRRDHTGPGMTFIVKYLATFRIPFAHFKAACCPSCRPVGDIRFKTGYTKVEEADTPAELDLYHKSTTLIRAYSGILGLNCTACKAKGYPKSDGIVKPGAPIAAAASAPAIEKGVPITLGIEDQTGYKMTVKTMRSSTLDVVMDAYATQAMRDRAILRFLFEGERLLPDETPEQLDLMDNDIINVFMEQVGGAAQLLRY
ncbi:Small ubiquitin- modifier 2 [Teratosphaeriaceae sp. CCFEE 6253]|nr:Small ubiquitin- modifier 2 [Teratosphaeriaceae sp. CCFEE 6253]